MTDERLPFAIWRSLSHAFLVSLPRLIEHSLEGGTALLERPGTLEPGGLLGCSPHFFPNVTLKQLRFKTLGKFPREAYKMLYFYLKSLHS